jgi:hypothetical protein
MLRNPLAKFPFELLRLIDKIDHIDKYLKTPTEEEKQRYEEQLRKLYAERDVLSYTRRMIGHRFCDSCCLGERGAENRGFAFI